MDTLEEIILFRFEYNLKNFRQLQDYEYPDLGDIVVVDDIIKFCTGPFYQSVGTLKKRREVKYYREYPNSINS